MREQSLYLLDSYYFFVLFFLTRENPWWFRNYKSYKTSFGSAPYSGRSYEFDLGGTVAFLLRDHCTMLPWSVSRLFRNVHYTRENDCGKLKVPAGTRRLMKPLGLAAVESSKPELQPPLWLRTWLYIYLRTSVQNHCLYILILTSLLPRSRHSLCLFFNIQHYHAIMSRRSTV